MSQQPPESPENAVVNPIGIDYVLTEEERRLFKECEQESFWYRSLPIAAISMAFTQFLVSRGVVTASGRFGSLPKVAFAGVMGFMGGKMSYMNTCQEKFKSLEGSPLGEALRQRQRQHHQPPGFTHKHSELSDPNKADFEPDHQSFSYSSDLTYSDPMSSAAQYNTQIREPDYVEEDVRKKQILYEELRSKNRENYEVPATQKPEISPENIPAKRGKKNIYGDTWEE
ncbi:OCIA domain-containing protein 1-like [Puntigrus tetrazona]|uniref:OCIA domain-containing protein 1-like n=1 Tax=Puntigrus tetrazona TaxID=1606681 RepID=UPI001C8AE794|nr:OCIA domain-containing protein 1-like [Puntigrus tetrazona]